MNDFLIDGMYNEMWCFLGFQNIYYLQKEEKKALIAFNFEEKTEFEFLLLIYVILWI